MKKYAVWLLLLAAGLFFSERCEAQRAGFKALYIYHITSYTEWPPARSSGDIVIGVLGRSDVTRELEKTARIKKVRNRRLVIKQYDNVEDIGDCHVLFVPKAYTDRLGAIGKRIGNKATLIVTEGGNLCRRGSSISMLSRGRKKFEINRSHVESRGMKLSSQLLKLAYLCR